MRSFLMTGVILLVSTVIARGADDARQNVLMKMADAMAYERLCDQVEINPDKFRAAAMAFHLHLGSGEADNRKITVMGPAAVDALIESGDSEETLCRNALALYGPGGANAPDLLRTK